MTVSAELRALIYAAHRLRTGDPLRPSGEFLAAVARVVDYVQVEVPLLRLERRQRARERIPELVDLLRRTRPRVKECEICRGATGPHVLTVDGRRYCAHAPDCNARGRRRLGMPEGLCRALRAAEWTAAIEARQAGRAAA